MTGVTIRQSGATRGIRVALLMAPPVGADGFLLSELFRGSPALSAVAALLLTVAFISTVYVWLGLTGSRFAVVSPPWIPALTGYLSGSVFFAMSFWVYTRASLAFVTFLFILWPLWMLTTVAGFRWLAEYLPVFLFLPR